MGGTGDKISRVCFVLCSIHLWFKMLLDILSENFLHDIEDQLAHLEHAITDALILAITGHNCTQVECELLAPLVRMGGTRLTNPYQVVVLGSVSSTKISGLLPQQKKGRHELPDDNGIGTVQWEMPQVKNQYQKEPDFCTRFQYQKVPDFWKNVENCVSCNLQRHI